MLIFSRQFTDVLPWYFIHVTLGWWVCCMGLVIGGLVLGGTWRNLMTNPCTSGTGGGIPHPRMLLSTETLVLYAEKPFWRSPPLSRDFPSAWSSPCLSPIKFLLSPEVPSFQQCDDEFNWIRSGQSSLSITQLHIVWVLVEVVWQLGGMSRWWPSRTSYKHWPPSSTSYHVFTSARFPPQATQLRSEISVLVTKKLN